jgi:hypothetical protein
MRCAKQTEQAHAPTRVQRRGAKLASGPVLDRRSGASFAWSPHVPEKNGNTRRTNARESETWCSLKLVIRGEDPCPAELIAPLLRITVQAFFSQYDFPLLDFYPRAIGSMLFPVRFPVSDEQRHSG